MGQIRALAAQQDTRIKLHDVLTRLLTEGGFSGTRKQVCAAVGISPSALSQMARGQTKPSLDTLVRLADFFRVSLDYLVLGEQPVPAAPAADYGPLARSIDLSLARLQAQSDERVDLVARIGRALAEQIEHVARGVASTSPSLAGVLKDEETMLLEAYSVQTWIFSMNLHYDIILAPGPPPAPAAEASGEPARSGSVDGAATTGGAGVEAAGRFLPVVAQNLSRGRRYRFLLPAAVRDWRPVVQSYRTLLTKDLPNAQAVLNNCPFRATPGPGRGRLRALPARPRRPGTGGAAAAGAGAPRGARGLAGVHHPALQGAPGGRPDGPPPPRAGPPDLRRAVEAGATAVAAVAPVAAGSDPGACASRPRRGASIGHSTPDAPGAQTIPQRGGPPPGTAPEVATAKPCLW